MKDDTIISVNTRKARQYDIKQFNAAENLRVAEEYRAGYKRPLYSRVRSIADYARIMRGA